MEEKKYLFDKETLLTKNDSLEVFVIQTFTKRQKECKSASNFQNHQYKLYLKKKNEELILIDSLLNILENAIFSIIRAFESFYKTEEKKIVYLSLTQENCFNACYSLPFVLQSTSNVNKTKTITNNLIVHLNSFLSSNKNVPLMEKSFFVTFKVI